MFSIIRRAAEKGSTAVLSEKPYCRLSLIKTCCNKARYTSFEHAFYQSTSIYPVRDKEISF
jgi:hypothetical protein